MVNRSHGLSAMVSAVGFVKTYVATESIRS